MRIYKYAAAIPVALTVCLAGPSLALASGNAKAIRECTSQERDVTGPGAYQAFRYSEAQPTSAGKCWVTELKWPIIGDAWAGYDTSEGLPNDTIQSVEVGSAVRVKLFWGWFYSQDHGAPYAQGPSTWTNLGSPWSRNASALRLEWTGMSCTSLSNQIAIWDFAGAPGSGDCTVLTNGNHYNNAVKMAFRNDNMSAFASGPSASSFQLFNASDYGSWLTNTFKMNCGNLSNLRACGIYNYGNQNADNKISSIY